eukprot:1117041-Lingulodinium_polyedra.AAC.1
MERARVLFASRCGSKRSIPPHHCAPFLKRRTMTRSNRPSAATTAHSSHARRLHTNTKTGVRAECTNARFVNRCLGAAWVLLGC